MTKARERSRKRKRLNERDNLPLVPKWGQIVFETVTLFVILACVRAWLSDDGFAGKTFLWAGMVAVTLAAFNEWQRRRRKVKRSKDG